MEFNVFLLKIFNMLNISFNVPDDPAKNKVLNDLEKLNFISDLKVIQLDKGLVLPEKKAGSVNDLLMDWSDIEGSVQDFRKKLWPEKSF